MERPFEKGAPFCSVPLKTGAVLERPFDKRAPFWSALLKKGAVLERPFEKRAPFLHYIPGLWKNTPLPSLSIGHASGWAYVALIEHGWRIGIDAEPSARGLQSNAFDLMSKGEELHTLRQSPEHAIELWVCKEAVQKTLGMGMHLNPREIVIPIGVANTIISIEKSKIQLINWQYQGTCIAVAFHQGKLDVTTPEDRLLEATRSAMQDGDWGVGCKTTSGRV